MTETLVKETVVQAAAPHVVARGLVKTFGTHRVLDAVDLTVASGESIAILGPSGSGKTTLLRLIAGLDVPEAGEVEIGGRLASRPGRVVIAPHARGIGVVFQSSALWPHMTLAQNIAFALHGPRREGAQARVAALLAEVGLEGFAERYPDQISGGEARRVALARALAADPQLVLMDEPLTNLDADRRAQMLELVVRSIQRTSAALIYVTHEAEEAARVAGRVLVMRQGRLEEGETRSAHH
jgi:iron(III) transport system ATP-binding protein